MRKANIVLAAALVALFIGSPSHAGGPFGLFKGSSLLGCGGCDSAPCDSPGCCDSSTCCDSTGCCDSDGGCDSAGCCGTSGCGLFGGLFTSSSNVGCDSGPCDSGCCDSGSCDSMGCSASSSCPLRRLFGSSSRDRGCDSMCDGGCDSLCCEKPKCCYHTLFGGWTSLEDYRGQEVVVPPPAPTLEGLFNDGWGIGAAIGRRMNESNRIEAEFMFRSITGDQWLVDGVPADWSGHGFAYSLMANLIRDLNGLQIGGVTPYVGGGIGVLFVDASMTSALGTIELQDEAFAYQFIAGASKAVRSDLELFSEYRYLGSTEMDVTNQSTGMALATTENEFHNVLFGARIYR